MRTALRPDLKTKTYSVNKSYSRLTEKEISLINFKLYQKLFVLLVSLSAILIIPESPRKLENICESHNSRKICNVW